MNDINVNQPVVAPATHVEGSQEYRGEELPPEVALAYELFKAEMNELKNGGRLGARGNAKDVAHAARDLKNTLDNSDLSDSQKSEMLNEMTSQLGEARDQDYGCRSGTVRDTLGQAESMVNDAKIELAGSTTSDLDDIALRYGGKVGSLALQISADSDRLKALETEGAPQSEIDALKAEISNNLLKLEAVLGSKEHSPNCFDFGPLSGIPEGTKAAILAEIGVMRQDLGIEPPTQKELNLAIAVENFELAANNLENGGNFRARGNARDLAQAARDLKVAISESDLPETEKLEMLDNVNATLGEVKAQDFGCIADRKVDTILSQAQTEVTQAKTEVTGSNLDNIAAVIPGEMGDLSATISQYLSELSDLKAKGAPPEDIQKLTEKIQADVAKLEELVAQSTGKFSGGVFLTQGLANVINAEIAIIKDTLAEPYTPPAPEGEPAFQSISSNPTGIKASETRDQIVVLTIQITNDLASWRTLKEEGAPAGQVNALKAEIEKHLDQLEQLVGPADEAGAGADLAADTSTAPTIADIRAELAVPYTPPATTAQGGSQ